MLKIRQALDIEVGAETGSWRYVPRLKNQQGAEIDLLFDRSDGIRTICEIKYNNKPFVINKSYAKVLQDKMDIYKKHLKNPKQFFLAMVTVEGIKPSIHSKELVTGVTVLSDLFKIA